MNCYRDVARPFLISSLWYIAWNLINGVDIDATQARVQRYERENKEIIAKNENMRVCWNVYLFLFYMQWWRRYNHFVTNHALCLLYWRFQANEDKFFSIQLELEKERKSQQREAYQRQLEEEESAKKASEIEAIEELVRWNWLMQTCTWFPCNAVSISHPSIPIIFG